MTPHLVFTRRPSTLALMARAFLPRPGYRGAFPELGATWRRRAEPGELDALGRLTGLAGAPALQLLYPQVVGFRLAMVLLTHPSFPLPLWRALQIRNRLLQHHEVPAAAPLTFTARVAASRVVERGVEVDLHTRVCAGEAPCWESVNTFYYRGRFGEPAGAPPPAPPPLPDEPVAGWELTSRPGWQLAGLTGDYNGIHWWDAYARRFGFQRALHHPQLVLGQCLARLGAPPPPVQLETWLKGPVYYRTTARLNARRAGGETVFSLVPGGEARPAIVGRLRALSPGGTS